MRTLSVVIPALNEEKGIGPVLKEIPIKELRSMGYNVEVLVIDNGSQDKTPHIARSHGARVVVQPIRGYGNAYKAGFANAHGHIIATGDADLTYPFTILPAAIRKLEKEHLDFINTDRLTTLRKEVMEGSHVFGNWLLSRGTKLLFGWPYKDSQSGMWIFKRQIWPHLDVRSSGMPFSQELKIEAHARGFKCAEIPIDYRARAGEVKLNTIADGIGNILHLIRKRVQLGIRVSKADVKKIEREWKSPEFREQTAFEKTNTNKEWETATAQ
jgi:glycosyltransferase involved in cell wall biosynthesis